jgi:hypothetical protein
LGLAAAVAVGGLVLSGCGSFRAERQGKQVGDAICNLKGSNVDDAPRAADKVQRQMNDLQRIVGRPVQEDVSDIRNNLSDLRTHVLNGNDALVQQDIAVIQRNFKAVGRTLTDKGRAAYDGVQEGLAGCDYS